MSHFLLAIVVARWHRRRLDRGPRSGSRVRRGSRNIVALGRPARVAAGAASRRHRRGRRRPPAAVRRRRVSPRLGLAVRRHGLVHVRSLPPSDRPPPGRHLPLANPQELPGNPACRTLLLGVLLVGREWPSGEIRYRNALPDGSSSIHVLLGRHDLDLHGRHRVRALQRPPAPLVSADRRHASQMDNGCRSTNRPTLRRPVLIAAFRGSNDGGPAATLPREHARAASDARNISPRSTRKDSSTFSRPTDGVTLVEGLTREEESPENALTSERSRGRSRRLDPDRGRAELPLACIQ